MTYEIGFKDGIQQAHEDIFQRLMSYSDKMWDVDSSLASFVIDIAERIEAGDL